MPLRPHHLTVMFATLAPTVDTAVHRAAGRTVRPVTICYESGHRQVCAAPAHRLRRDQGGVVAVETSADTGFVVYAGTACHPTLAVGSGRGRTEFAAPICAATILIEDAAPRADRIPLRVR